jgi:hypothetical protein
LSGGEAAAGRLGLRVPRIYWPIQVFRRHPVTSSTLLHPIPSAKRAYRTEYLAGPTRAREPMSTGRRKPGQ